MKSLMQFLSKLEEKKIFYKLNKIRESILVEIAVPGERWEVEFFENGEVQVERFFSDGEISGEESLKLLFSQFSD
ncbi:MAG: hypothetical protein ABFC56_10705 [Clostridiaceae bacterium]